MARRRRNPHPDAPRSLEARGGPFEPGATVRFTREFLRSTGQYKGSEATGRWRVVPCSCAGCASGDYLALNQPSDVEGWNGWRHVNAANVERVRGSAVANPGQGFTPRFDVALGQGFIVQKSPTRWADAERPWIEFRSRGHSSGGFNWGLHDTRAKRLVGVFRKFEDAYAFEHGTYLPNPGRQMALPWWTGKRLVTKAGRARIEAAQDAFRNAVRRTDYPSPRARADAIEAARERVGEIQARVQSEAAQALRLRTNPRKWDEVSREQWNGYLAALSARGTRKEWRSAQSPADKAKGQPRARVQYVAVDGRDVGMTWTEMPWGERRFFIPARGRRPRRRFGETITPNPRRGRRKGRRRAR